MDQRSLFLALIDDLIDDHPYYTGSEPEFLALKEFIERNTKDKRATAALLREKEGACNVISSPQPSQAHPLDELVALSEQAGMYEQDFSHDSESSQANF